MVTQRARRKAPPAAGRRTKPAAAAVDDINLTAAGLLYDMASLQPTERSQFGYKRAAKATMGLPVRVEDLVRTGTLRQVPFVGPSSERVVTELVQTGRSATVDSAIEQSGKRAAVDAKRELRKGYLSQLALQAALSAPAPKGTIERAQYRGDFQMHSSWSDGAEGIGTMAEACAGLGHGCLGITDHSYGLPIAGGMAMEAVARQHGEIDRLNAGYDGRFRIFKGIEANILFELAARALDAGCIFALDSDAHAVGELRFSEFAIAHARLAGIPAKRIINCWSNAQLDDWMETRK